jgi:arylsulfatase A-like enzyme
VARSYSSNDESNASYSTHIFSRRAVEIVQEHAEGESPPFFIYLAYQATHAPLQAPPEVVQSFADVKDPSRRTLAAMAAVVDEGVGNITDALMSTGNNNTVFFISGDNGGQVRAGGNNWPYRGFKGSLWEGGCRASAFVWSPLLPRRQNFVWHGLVHVSNLPLSAWLASPTRSTDP